MTLAGFTQPPAPRNSHSRAVTGNGGGGNAPPRLQASQGEPDKYGRFFLPSEVLTDLLSVTRCSNRRTRLSVCQPRTPAESRRKPGMAALPGDFRHARHAGKITALEERRRGAQIQVETHGERLAAAEQHGLAGFARFCDPVEHLRPAGAGGLSIGQLEEMERG